jgi:hypothetical protein
MLNPSFEIERDGDKAAARDNRSASTGRSQGWGDTNKDRL